MNLVEKIISRYLVSGNSVAKVRTGDFVALNPRHVMTHDNTSAVMAKFKSTGAPKILHPNQPVFALDHNVQDTSDANKKKYTEIENFAKTHGVDFYPAGRGIGHQVMVEEGYAFPGSLAVGSDSHSNMYGGVGCLGTPVVRTDATSIWVTGQTWWQVPAVANVILEGQLPPGVTGKDVIITLCGFFNKDEVLNYAVEFSGSGLSSLTVEERLTIANMTTEWGALVGLFPVDEVAIKWLQERAYYLHHRGPSGVASDPLIANYKTHREAYHNPRVNTKSIEHLLRNLPQAERGATYAKTIRLDLSTVVPHVSGPNHVKVMHSVADLEQKEVKIHKAYIVSCVNSRVADLAQAASVLKGRKVAPHVELYIAPASNEVHAESLSRGDWQTLLTAGAKPLPAGCGPCIGLGAGLLQPGEVGISATNRNFKGRMGSPDALAYLASPAVVAASAVMGKIASPTSIDRSFGAPSTSSPLKASIQSEKASMADMSDIPLEPLIPNFPRSLSGNLVWCNQDNINTDGIYPGKYTYREDIAPTEMAKVSMENYDPAFNSVCQAGDILVAGYNFGTGSSREQAATCLKHKGIPVVLAGSYSSTYQRNAFNNGFLVLECPALVEHLRQHHNSDKPTIRVNNAPSKPPFHVDLLKWKAIFNSIEYPIRPVGATAQDLIVAGGLEPWIIRESKRLQSQ